MEAKTSLCPKPCGSQLLPCPPGRPHPGSAPLVTPVCCRLHGLAGCPYGLVRVPRVGFTWDMPPRPAQGKQEGQCSGHMWPLSSHLRGETRTRPPGPELGQWAKTQGRQRSAHKSHHGKKDPGCMLCLPGKVCWRGLGTRVLGHTCHEHHSGQPPGLPAQLI